MLKQIETGRRLRRGRSALLAALPAWANAAAAPADGARRRRRPPAMVNKGDVAWMLVSSALVLMMSVPGLALFYGGLVRTKNMLSVLMQVLTIVCVAGAGLVSAGAIRWPSPTAARQSASSAASPRRS